MRCGIGIDTGGTFTDAVIWDLEKKKVLSSYKARTTHENLSVGIINALDGLDQRDGWQDICRCAQQYYCRYGRNNY